MADFGKLNNDLQNIHHAIEVTEYLSTYLTYGGYKTEAMAVAIQKLTYELEKQENYIWEQLKEATNE